MSEFTLIEAINSARQMANFFKSFKKIEEVVAVAVMLEQNIKELELKKSKLISEIDSLIEKKEIAEKNLTERIEIMRVELHCEEDAKDLELKIIRDKFEKEKEEFRFEIEAIKAAKMNTLVEHENTMVQIKAEKDEVEKILVSIKGELQNIKNRFN